MTTDSQRDRDLSHVVLGMMLANGNLLDLAKADLDPADFSASVRVLAAAAMRGDLETVVEEAKRAWSIEHTSERVSTSIVKSFIENAERKRLIKEADKLALCVRLMRPEQAGELAKQIEAMNQKARATAKDRKP